MDEQNEFDAKLNSIVNRQLLKPPDKNKSKSQIESHLEKYKP